MSSDRKICVGQFTGAHGVRGLAKLRSFTEDPSNLFTYTPLTDETGTHVFNITLKSSAKEFFIVSVDGVESKEAADMLRGDKIFVARTILPKPNKNQYFEVDLIGLHVSDAQGKDYGAVMAVHDHGAGVFMEIGLSRKDSFMLPFTDAYVPLVDITGGKIKVVVPEGWL